jgi:hypothetical protein
MPTADEKGLALHGVTSEERQPARTRLLTRATLRSKYVPGFHTCLKLVMLALITRRRPFRDCSVLAPDIVCTQLFTIPTRRSARASLQHRLLRMHPQRRRDPFYKTKLRETLSPARALPQKHSALCPQAQLKKSPIDSVTFSAMGAYGHPA